MKTPTPLTPPSETHLTDDEYRLLWATSTDAIVIMDEHGTIRYANPATLDVFGYSPARLVGNNIAIVQPERLREAHRLGVTGLLRGENNKLNRRATESVGLHRRSLSARSAASLTASGRERSRTTAVSRSTALAPRAPRRCARATPAAAAPTAVS